MPELRRGADHLASGQSRWLGPLFSSSHLCASLNIRCPKVSHRRRPPCEGSQFRFLRACGPPTVLPPRSVPDPGTRTVPVGRRGRHPASAIRSCSAPVLSSVLSGQALFATKLTLWMKIERLLRVNACHTQPKSKCSCSIARGCSDPYSVQRVAPSAREEGSLSCMSSTRCLASAL